MSTVNPADVRLSTGGVAGVLRCSSKKVSDLCDLDDGDPERLPCSRDGSAGNRRSIRLLDLARFVVQRNDRATAERLWAHATGELAVSGDDLRAYLHREGVPMELFPSGKEVILLVASPPRESGRIAPNYDETLYRVESVSSVHDVSLQVGGGIIPNLVAIDFGGAGAGAALGLISWLLARPQTGRTVVFAAIPEDGIGAALPEIFKHRQRPGDMERAVLDAFPPRSLPDVAAK